MSYTKNGMNAVLVLGMLAMAVGQVQAASAKHMKLAEAPTGGDVSQVPTVDNRSVPAEQPLYISSGPVSTITPGTTSQSSTELSTAPFNQPNRGSLNVPKPRNK